MTKGTFTKALDNIDPAYVSEAVNYKEKAQSKKSLVLKIASVAACFVIVLTGVLIATMRKTPGDEMITVGVGQEMVINPSTSGKPTTGHKIGMKYYPFYADKKITFNVFMSQPQSNEELDGYPVFEVYQGFAENVPYINLYKDDHNVVINGIEKSFEKRFTLDDLSFLRASSYDEDVFERHGEKVTLDFSGFDPGEAVTVTFSYGFFYYKNNPYNQPQPDNSWCGRRISLHFYIGEQGIAVSANSTEGALYEYEKATGIKPGLWDHIDAINRSGESSYITHR